MLFVNENNVKHLLSGSLILGTGGGLTIKEHKKIFDIAFKRKKQLSVKDLKEFKDSDWLCSGYGVGDPSKIQQGFGRISKKAFKIFSDYTKRSYCAVIPGEIGAEALAFLFGYPVIDADLVGGRAAPRMEMDVFSVFNVPICPLIAMNLQGEFLILGEVKETKKIEDTLRKFFSVSGGCGLVIGYPVQVRQFKKVAAQHTISESLKLGRLANSNLSPQEKIEALKKDFQARIIFKGVVRSIKQKKREGFFCGEAIVKNKTKSCLIYFQNENLIAKVNGKTVATVPHLIVLLDNKILAGIHNTELKRGRKVVVAVLPAKNYWLTPKGKELFGPKAFGFQMQPKLVC